MINKMKRGKVLLGVIFVIGLGASALSIYTLIATAVFLPLLFSIAGWVFWVFAFKKVA